MTTLHDCQALDATDALRPLRAHFTLPEGMVYLDGNSLGAMPSAAAARVADVVTREWGRDLIGSWNSARWFDLPQRLGDRVATLVGAGKGEVVVTDSTSVNLYKVLHAAIAMAQQNDPGRRVVLSERANFPTDLYIAQGLCAAQGLELRLVDAQDIPTALADPHAGGVAVLMLTHVNYRTGAMFDMQATTAAAHAAGALAIWDLAHSAGAVPVDLLGAQADFAIGCGYKYLNGGPGAPAFVWVHPRHADAFWQPLSGWWGHAAPFSFTPEYRPAPGIGRYLCGTQPIISLSALECGLDVFQAAEALGGMAALRRKSLALTDLFITLVEERCAGHGLALVTPRDHAQRGSQVCLSRHDPHVPPLHGSLPPEGAVAALGRPGSGESGAYAIVQALIARNVVGDFRAGDPPGQADGVVPMPDILRFGFTPLYLGFEDVWNAVEQLRQVLESGEWQEARFHRQNAVT